jgi:hypothetical protein
MASSRRLLFVDVMRSVAIALALAAHAVNAFDVPDRLPHDAYVALRLMTRAANPSFVFMFGMMLELVYARKVAARGLDAVAPRLLWRSLQCYAGYVAALTAAFAAGLFGPAHYVQALVFIYGGSGADILQFYTLALGAAVGLLALRARAGIAATAAACFGLWLLTPVMDALVSVPVGRFSGLQDLLVRGLPLNLSFVAGGMLVGHALRAPEGRRTRVFAGRLALLAGLCLAVAAGILATSAPAAVLDGYLDLYQYRLSHHVGYYAFGLLQAVGLSAVLYAAFPPRRRALPAAAPLLAFGRSSLLAFTLGNALLSVVKATVDPAAVSPIGGLGGTAAVLAATLVLVAGVEAALRQVRARPALQPLLRPADALRRRVVAPAGRRLLALSRRTAWRVRRLCARSSAASSEPASRQSVTREA